ncbi:hypothetical protein FB45DRAFT_901094 [Roridomyces roridus]|uniref:Uncharacterized protein n=1 Tax=Roridomyces roridus TaxID=1738132 RepID=A0AAD7FVU3_9AGAR|nr:hypothetical protein FB45DRAFT_901094 [Roridomyces roridus]
MIVVEVSCLFILSVLFLATGADGAPLANGFRRRKNCTLAAFAFHTLCGELFATMAFSFLNCIILAVYSIFIFSRTIVLAKQHGNGVWKLPVAEAPFFLSPDEPDVDNPAAQMKTAPSSAPATVNAAGYAGGGGETGPASNSVGGTGGTVPV